MFCGDTFDTTHHERFGEDVTLLRAHWERLEGGLVDGAAGGSDEAVAGGDGQVQGVAQRVRRSSSEAKNLIPGGNSVSMFLLGSKWPI